VTKDEIRGAIEALVKKFDGNFNPPIERLKKNERFDPPSRKDWEFLEAKFRCSFGPDFVSFVEVITDYNLPGMLNVTREGRTNGDPTFDWWYDREMGFGSWNADLIPFISVGNGDFFCLSASSGAQSGVYFVDHENGTDERLTASFPEWLERLEYFLNG
jgi:SMI1-KNR4 cell-wall